MKRKIFHDVKIIQNPNFSAHPLFPWNAAHSCALCVAAAERVVATETVQCGKLLSGPSRRSLPTLLQMGRRKGSV